MNEQFIELFKLAQGLASSVHELREWHRQEYQSNKQIDDRADYIINLWHEYIEKTRKLS